MISRITRAGAMAALAVVALVGCVPVPGEPVPPAGELTDAVAGGERAGDWRTQIDVVDARVDELLALAARHPSVGGADPGAADAGVLAFSEPGPTSLGETLLSGAAAVRVGDGVAEVSAERAIAVFDDGHGERWHREATLRVPHGAAASIVLAGIDEHRRPGGGSLEVQASASGTATPRGTRYDVELRVSLELVTRPEDRTDAGSARRARAQASVTLADVPLSGTALERAVRALAADGALRVQSDDERLHAMSGTLIADLVSALPNVELLADAKLLGDAEHAPRTASRDPAAHDESGP
ncbi:hypothetical protein [Microbacterium sp. No. 7]|uniref:hypothetical protein n=1 Tax=Microbacterium sp. No. 7 TaxID=1714373 RepID=UPI0006D048F5|nr:hypothetical protein [Microbacterium sp. No. 7]